MKFRPIRFAAALGFGVLLAGSAAAAPVPRFIPDHDAMGVYQVEQPGKPVQTWRVRFQAGSRRLHATGLSGQAQGVSVLLDLGSGEAYVILPQMHAVVSVPGVSGLMARVTDERGAHVTRLGEATIAGHRCTRYLVLKAKGDGSACITPGGVILAASGKDTHGAVDVTALSMADAPQPPGYFALPQGYSNITLPPQMLAQLLGG